MKKMSVLRGGDPGRRGCLSLLRTRSTTGSALVAPPPTAAHVLAVPRTNGMAIASLVLGILFLYGVGSILALILGYTAKGQIDRSEGAERGRGLAIGGIVLGWIGIAGAVFIFSVAFG
jgi:Domain of unknown function (DUF4190)